MKLGILGTGQVARTLGTAFIARGHEVVLGSRSPDHEGAAQWAAELGGAASNGTFADAAAAGEVLLNCTNGQHSLDALGACHTEDLTGKVVLDVANPLDFSQGMPPTLTVCNDDSLAERITSAYPAVRLVKTLNTVNAQVMVDPIPGTHVFLSGDDDEAKATARSLLRDLGWLDDQVIDLGDVSTARGPEMWLPLWVRLMQAQGTAEFNLAIVTR